MENINIINKKTYQSDSISNITELQSIYTFWRSAFEGFNGVTIETFNSYMGMNVYLDANKRMLFKFDASENTNDEYLTLSISLIKDNITMCTFNNSNNVDGHYFYKTNYGVLLTLENSYNETNVDSIMSQYTTIFTPTEVPTVICKFANGYNSESTDWIISLNHESVENLKSNSLIVHDYTDQKFVLMNAFTMKTPINTPHVFRVIGVPSSSHLKGKIKVGDKYFIWVGKYALETDE